MSSSPDKKVLTVDGLLQFSLVPEEDFAENGSMAQTGWAYQIIFYFDCANGSRLLFKGGFINEEEAIAAGKERLRLYCQGLIDELQGKISLYEQVFQAVAS